MDEGSSNFFDRVQFAFNNAPKGRSGALNFIKPILWAMGQPDSMIPGKGLNEYFATMAMRRGQNPGDVIPGWGGGASAAQPSTPAADPNTKGLAPWYVDWMRTKGIYGGVTPSKGILDE